MKSSKAIAEEMDVLIGGFVPKWRVISKQGSRFYRVLSWLPPLIFFRKRFMEDYWTTIGFTAAYPVGAEHDWEVRAHEGLHGIQARRWSRPLLGFFYLFPQSLLIPLGIALALIFSPWFWVLAGIGTLPLPAPFRMLFELEAYQLSVMIETWCWGPEEAEEYIKRIIDFNFAGATYYYMWPFKKWIRKQLLKARAAAQCWSTKTNKDVYCDSVYRLVLTAGRMREEFRPQPNQE